LELLSLQHQQLNIL